MRTYSNINDNWQFFYKPTTLKDVMQSTGEAVNVPHTWNAFDGADGGNDYYRDTCYYKKQLDIKKTDGDVYLEFKGVNAKASVYLNGELVCEHIGGYSTFRANITNFIKDENILVVAVDNSKVEYVYPQTADFTFYGGIYRDVNIIYVDKEHFDLDYFGSKGITATPTVDGSTGNVKIVAYTKSTCQVKTFIYDGDELLFSGDNNAVYQIENVKLWKGIKDPHLYTAKAQLVKDGEVVDELSTRFGFRTYYVDKDKGFFLNGESYPLHGVSRHQDRKGMGNAITKKEHLEDINLIKEVGANTIRLAHYQHDDYFYDLCDEMGFVVWAEIPYISRHMPEADENAVSQMKELIYQQYNHPSICFWGVSNEITMFKKAYPKDMIKLHHQLNDLCHELDPSRLTTLAVYASSTPFNKYSHITDVVGWNLYLGWYTPFLWLNDLLFGIYRLCFPNLKFSMSEYGAEGMPNLHAVHPKRGDNTEEYQLKYHEYMLKFFAKRKFFWGTYVWNMFDFAADARDQGGEPGMNHKGLVTYDRKLKKDVFYLYKAHWSDDPFVYITGKRFVNRTGNKLNVKIYSNQPQVELFINGVSQGVKKGDKIFNYTVKMQDVNDIKVVSGDLVDTAKVIKVNKKDESYILRKINTKNWQK